jgi:sorting nexin-8
LGIADLHVFRMWREMIQNQIVNVRDIPELPKALYALVEEKFALTTARLVKEETSQDNTTTKLLIELQDGARVETVIMRYGRFELRNFPEEMQKRDGEGNLAFQSNERASVCVSSQVGCQMGCTFCATGTPAPVGDPACACTHSPRTAPPGFLSRRALA